MDSSMSSVQEGAGEEPEWCLPDRPAFLVTGASLRAPGKTSRPASSRPALAGRTAAPAGRPPPQLPYHLVRRFHRSDPVVTEGEGRSTDR